MKEYNKLSNCAVDEYVLRGDNKRKENPCIFGIIKNFWKEGGFEVWS